MHPADLPFVMEALESATAEKSIQIDLCRFINK